MNDREMLELGAKAAGFQWNPTISGSALYGCFETDVNQTTYAWNPFADDGDALQLAAQLEIDITYKAFGEDEVLVSASDDRFLGWFTVPYGNDKLAATRRAIMRAAAEIGKVVP